MNLKELKDGNRVVLTAPQRKSLKDGGFTTVELLTTATKNEIVALPGISELTANKVLKAAYAAILPNQFRTAKQVKEDRDANVKFVTTGSSEFNELLGGGIETCSITEIAGKNGAGKTQLCLNMCVNIQLPEELGGLDANSLYFDTEDTFRAERIVEMAMAKKELFLKAGLKEKDFKKWFKKVLDRITVAYCYTSDHQALLINNCEEVVDKNGVKLIVVDSLMSHFRAEYIGREMLGPRQQKINSMLGKLHDFAKVKHLMVLVTNQMVSNPQPFGASEKPTGGHVVGHAPTTRLQIRRPKTASDVRILKCSKSPWRPVGERAIKITEGGIVDGS